MSNIFELATRKAIRFQSNKGLLTVEQLWQLPLQGATSLDEVAKAINRQLKDAEDVSFVEPVSSDMSGLQLQMDIVKHIISVKVSERDEAVEKQKKKALKLQLESILQQKKDAELQQLTVEQIQAELAKLG